MKMAFLFRQEQKKSPFAMALEELIDTKGQKLILASGYIAVNTKLIDWIITACKNGFIKDIVIIGAYIDPKIDGGISQHKKIQDMYNGLKKELSQLGKDSKYEKVKNNICNEMIEIQRKHLIDKFLPYWLSSHSINEIELLRMQCYPERYVKKVLMKFETH